ncbi:MAG: DUF6252 family protein [Bacteroidota bacterium]|nr:DUF6252 family protein [Bacteroidota bacterium]
MQIRFTENSLTCFCLLILLAITSCNTTDTGISQAFPDCYDNIQNQGEQGVDCGGPCVPCPGKVSAIVDGAPWVSAGNVSSSVNNNSIIILSGNGTSTLSLIHTGPFVNGTYSLQSALYGITATGVNYLSNQGTITFTHWDAIQNQVSGSFSFSAIESSGTGDTILVTNGNFQFVSYQP